jgi:hypothetical protein
MNDLTQNQTLQKTVDSKKVDQNIFLKFFGAVTSLWVVNAFIGMYWFALTYAIPFRFDGDEWLPHALAISASLFLFSAAYCLTCYSLVMLDPDAFGQLAPNAKRLSKQRRKAINHRTLLITIVFVVLLIAVVRFTPPTDNILISLLFIAAPLLSLLAIEAIVLYFRFRKYSKLNTKTKFRLSVNAVVRVFFSWSYVLTAFLLANLTVRLFFSRETNELIEHNYSFVSDFLWPVGAHLVAGICIVLCSWLGCLMLRRFGIAAPVIFLGLLVFLFQFNAPYIGPQTTGLGWRKNEVISIDIKAIGAVVPILKPGSELQKKTLAIATLGKENRPDSIEIPVDVVSDLGTYVVITQAGAMTPDMKCIYKPVEDGDKVSHSSKKVLTRCVSLPRAMLIAR